MLPSTAMLPADFSFGPPVRRPGGPQKDCAPVPIGPRGPWWVPQVAILLSAALAGRARQAINPSRSSHAAVRPCGTHPLSKEVNLSS